MIRLRRSAQTMRPGVLHFPGGDRRPAQVRRWLLGMGPWVQQLAAAGMLALSGGLLGTMGWQVGTLQDQLAAARRAQTSPKAMARPAASTSDLGSAAGWNQALEALNVPWTTLLDTLEQHTPPAVALVALAPEPRLGRLRLQAEARTLDTLLAYATALREEAGFQEVRVIQHETRDRDLAQPVRLTLQLDLPGTRSPHTR